MREGKRDQCLPALSSHLISVSCVQPSSMYLSGLCTNEPLSVAGDVRQNLVEQMSDVAARSGESQS